jgi:hypothetical protein
VSGVALKTVARSTPTWIEIPWGMYFSFLIPLESRWFCLLKDASEEELDPHASLVSFVSEYLARRI